MKYYRLIIFLGFALMGMLGSGDLSDYLHLLKKSKEVPRAYTSKTVSEDHHTPVPEDLGPLFYSEDYGLSWKSCGEGLPDDAQVSFLEAVGEELILATDNRGLFMSAGGREEWYAIGEGLPGAKINALRVLDSTIYVSVYEYGLYSSNDWGMNWTSLNENLADRRIQAIQWVDGRLLLGTDSGIYARDAETLKWKELFKGIQVLNLDSEGQKVVAGTNEGSLLSIDGGEQWTWIHRKGAVHYTRLLPSSIVEMDLGGALYISRDDGDHWINAEYHPSAGSYIYDVIEAGPYMLMSNNYGVHRSSDMGDFWYPVYFTEKRVFFDFVLVEGIIYGGMRHWEE